MEKVMNQQFHKLLKTAAGLAPVDILLLLASSEGDAPKVIELIAAGANLDTKVSNPLMERLSWLVVGRAKLATLLQRYWLDAVSSLGQSLPMWPSKAHQMHTLCAFLRRKFRPGRRTRCASGVLWKATWARTAPTTRQHQANPFATTLLAYLSLLIPTDHGSFFVQV